MRIIANSFIEASSSILDTPVPFNDFLKEDGTYHSINSFCEVTNRAVQYNQDKTRFIFAYELSDLHNIYGGIKEVLRNNGLVGGGDNFTQTADNLFWILTYSEKNEFMKVNPNWKQTNEQI